MPIFEYRCESCGREFETLVLKGTVPACPACKSELLEKLLSIPAVKSDTTRALALKAAKKRDTRQADDMNRAQREYELHHDD